MRNLTILSLGALLAGCASGVPLPGSVPRASTPETTTTVAPPPQRPDPAPSRPTTGFRAPEVMRAPGLERVIGRSAGQLERQFGKAQLDVWEGDARKLQFAGEPCVLDIYLYPMQPGAAPSATHVEARRASDGAAVDRASCVRALRR